MDVMVDVKHHFVSAKADGTDSTLVKPSDWNAGHDVTTAADGVVLGRAPGAGAGAVQEVPMANMFPAGLVMIFAGATLPTGWLLCDGSVKNRTDYPALFTAIGTAYNTGGESTAQFRVPDCRGRVIAMLDGSTGRLPGWNTLGVAGGEASHQLNWNEMPQHNHGVSDPGHVHQLPMENYGLGGMGGGNVVQMIAGNAWTYNSGTGISIGYAGSNYGHNNIQHTIVMNMMIKT